MHPELHTHRLRLAPLDARDGDALHALSRDPQVMRWSSLPPQTRAQTDALLARWVAEGAAGVACCWLLHDNDGFVGQVSLFRIDRDNHRAELGYLLMPHAWHRGYASEAVAAAIRYAFGHLALCRLEADVDPDNLASWRVLEKNGFCREGILPKRWFKEGRFFDTWLYGLLNERRIMELSQAR